jgi:hypothetical protein
MFARTDATKSLTVTILRLRAHPVLAEDRLFAMVAARCSWGLTLTLAHARAEK